MNLRQYSVVFFLAFVDLCPLKAQNDSSWTTPPELRTSAFMDIFYAYDFSEKEESVRQPFLYHHNRHNEFNVNMALAHVEINHPRYRARLGLHTGTYAIDNYAAEPGLLQNIYEANIGIQLDPGGKWWLDAGVLPSYIGFESAISMDNPTLTRSLAAESSPYYISGAKISFKASDQWELAGYLMNGWQRIQRVQGNSMPSFGSQIVYTPTNHYLINWSTFIGTEDIDSERRIRYFSNLYGQAQLSDRFDITAGLDIGFQQVIKGSSEYDSWISPVIIGRYRWNPSLTSAMRVEYYGDPNSVIIPGREESGFETFGLSLNMDYSPSSMINCRLEGRWLQSQDAIFENGFELEQSNVFIVASMAFRWTHILQSHSSPK